VSKRYREAVEILSGSFPPDPPGTVPPDRPGTVPPGTAAPEDTRPPVGFVWRGATYRVVAVLGHWREDSGYWTGGGVEIPQRDLWRVEARNGTPATGVYELVCEQGVWRLDRVWD
jgi:hypothetical protein